MKKTTLFIFIFLVLNLSLIPAQKIAVLPTLEKPRAMELDRQHICILERYSVSIISSKNFELIKKIGKKGEGPGEWTLPFKFKMYPDMIVINTLRKLLVFSREGSLKYEIRKKDIFLSIIWPVGKHFVGQRANNDSESLTNSINILNKKLESLKEIAVLKISDSQKNSSVSQVNAFAHYSKFYVYDDLIFIADSRRGFYIEVFNSDGQLLYKIDKNSEVELLPVTEKIKSEFLKKNKNSDDIQLGKMFGKKTKYIFPKYFPAFKQIFIDGGKIYAVTFKTESDKNEVIIMDLKGKILKRTFLELKGQFLQVFDGAFYYLQDNIIDEKWELFCEPVVSL